MSAFRRSGSYLKVVLVCSVLALSACGDKSSQQGPGGMKVPVSAVTVKQETADISVDLPGRVNSVKNAEIRARVTGIVQAINFQQGSEVKEGQLLFTIDPAPYKAQRDQAAAALKRAQADLRAARLLADRYSKLIKANAVSRQDYDNAIAQAGQAEAAVAQAKAALEAADIDLGYTKVTSPISGRIGKSYVTEGALVSATQATLLADVQYLDSVYVDITRSTRELAVLRKAIANGTLTVTADGAARVKVLLEDGSTYPEDGKLLFSGVTVDPTTGQVSLRAEVPNPQQILLPGMYVRVRLQQGTDHKALLVPEQAVQRGSDGLNTLMVIKDGKVAPVAVTVGPLVDGRFIIYKGLNEGDQVIVEGFQKIRPGAPVQPQPWKPQADAPGAQHAGQPGSGQAHTQGQPDKQASKSESSAAR
jgi:membrane fusion protein (multidrug efflux system)